MSSFETSHSTFFFADFIINKFNLLVQKKYKDICVVGIVLLEILQHILKNLCIEEIK
jgi:hypothetical protein